MISSELNLDYDDVDVALNEGFVGPDFEADRRDPDTRFSRLGSREVPFPLVACYDARHIVDLADRDSISSDARDLGLLTAGDAFSDIPLYGSHVGYPSAILFDLVDPLALLRPREDLEMVWNNHSCQLATVWCARQAESLTNEQGRVRGIVVGEISQETAGLRRSMGIRVARVSLLERLSRSIDVPLIAVVENSAQACKAFVAGADAVMISVHGWAYGSDNGLARIRERFKSLSGISDAVRRLCSISGARRLDDLATRCRLARRSRER